jgi:hypothetical protein
MQTIGNPQTLLVGWSKEVTDIILRLREEMGKIDKNIVETVGRLSFDYRRKELFAYIRPYKEGVNLGFHTGSKMADPKKRLLGSGKHSRHFQISKLEQIDSYVTDMAKRAWVREA